MLLATLPRTSRRVARRAGFTLLEVLVVVAILVILATVATIATTRYLESAKKSKAQLQAKTIATAVEAYMTDPQNPLNTPPNSLEDLVQSGDGGTSFLKNGQQDLYDPWNQMYQVAPIVGLDGSTVYLIYTRAPDHTPISQFGVGPQLSRVPQ
jgi:general secretion pathway protein G